MEAKAIHRVARISPQKARLVADQVRGLPVGRATNILTFSTKKAAQIVKKVLQSAIANAENNQGADIDELKVTQIFVDEGDEVTLEFIGINGASHPTTIEAYGQVFELKRGHVQKVTFTADKPGRHSIVCATHQPTMTSELIVAPKN